VLRAPVDLLYFGGIGTNYATYKHDRDKVEKGEQSYAFSFQRRAPPVLPYRLACHGDAIRMAQASPMPTTRN
jgi:hypothetical protein